MTLAVDRAIKPQHKQIHCSYMRKYMTLTFVLAEGTQPSVELFFMNYLHTWTNGLYCVPHTLETKVGWFYSLLFHSFRWDLKLRSHLHVLAISGIWNLSTGQYTDFWKRGCEFQVFFRGGANLKKIPILRPKLGFYSQFLMKNCMIFK